MPCPACGSRELDLLVSCDDVAAEVRARRAFFAARIDGYVEPAQRKDRLDVAQAEPASIRICTPCGILVRGGSSADFVSDPYAPYVMEQMLRTYIDAYRHRQSWIRPLLPDGARVAEIGSYVGGFLHVAAEWGWSAIGIDIGEDTSHFARAHGYETRTATLQDCRFDDASLDGVFIWNTFEQIGDPASLLREVRRVLRPEGVLLIRTPNAQFYAMFEALLARPLDDHDPLVIALGHSNLLGLPHLFGYSADSLDRFVTRFGFDVVDHVSDRHIQIEKRLSGAARREEDAMNDAFARLETVGGPWFEAIYRAIAAPL